MSLRATTDCGREGMASGNTRKVRTWWEVRDVDVRSSLRSKECYQYIKLAPLPVLKRMELWIFADFFLPPFVWRNRNLPNWTIKKKKKQYLVAP